MSDHSMLKERPTMKRMSLIHNAKILFVAALSVYCLISSIQFVQRHLLRKIRTPPPVTWAFLNSTADTSEEKVIIDLEEVLDGPLAQDDTRIINYIKKNEILVPPSEKPYNLKSPEEDPSKGQSIVVKQILKNMRNGFFIECGALDGETRSNTLNLEKEYEWKGLLIEGDPSNFQLLLKKHRKAWSINVCLATKPFPHKVLYKPQFNVGRIIVDDISKYSIKKRDLIKVQCFPIFSILSTMDIKVVDYFSLDVEGNEFEVLRNIPFDKVLIKVLSVEYIHDTRNDSNILEGFMKTKGYRVVAKVNNADFLANDLIFVHSSVIVNESIKSIYTR